MTIQTTTRLTYDDLLQLPEEEGKHYEIIDGELLVNASPVPRHQRIVGNLYYAVRAYVETHGGEVFVSPLDVLFDRHNVVEPDILVIKVDRTSIVGPKNIQGAPNLVIEVLSDGSRRKDEVQKRKLYDRFGVDEYWIVDPELELVKIYRRTAAAFERVAEEGGTITTPLLPEFALDVRKLF